VFSKFDLQELGVTDAGDTILEQFRAVDQEIQRILKRVQGGEKFSPERLEALRGIRSVLGIEIRRFQPEFDETRLRDNLSKVAERAAEDFKKFISDNFAAIPVPRPGPLGIPIVTPELFPTGKTDRGQKDLFRRSLQARSNQIKDAIRTLTKAGRTEEIPIFTNLLKQVEELLKAIGRIPEEMAKAADSGGSFDRITFFVADADQAIKAFAEGMKRALTDQRKEAEKLVNAFGMVESAIVDAASRIGEFGALLEGDPGFIGPRQLINDNKVQTFNLVPDSVDDVEKSANDATASQQTRARK
jgi:hypothetical protein